MKVCNDHTVQTADKKVTPNSKLFQELDVNVPGLAGDVELNFSSLVDEGKKTGTIRTGPGSIQCGTHSPPSSSISVFVCITLQSLCVFVL